MKGFFAFALLLISLNVAFGQNEQSPIVEKDISYKNWSYKNVETGDEIDLRKFAKGKKLVMVVYFAPWCPNWKHDSPMLQRFYEKYNAHGLDIIGVGEYDTADAMKTNLDALKITFPVVYESQSRDNRQTTLHYGYRQSTGDTRKWGSPWYIFLEPSSLEKKGDDLLKKANVINGEIIEAEGEKFIRQKLGLPLRETKTADAKSKEIETCDPDSQKSTLKKP
jgi:thiol-disulfide isomerase/thioredoxin